jgi:hypothetical protein
MKKPSLFQRLSLSRRFFLGAALLCAAASSLLHATVDDSVSFAYEAALPYYRQGYSIRKDAWGGDLGVRDRKAVSSQLFKGNDYWFLMATDVKGATLSVHVYDDKGNLVDAESWQKGRFAGPNPQVPRGSHRMGVSLRLQIAVSD